MDILFGTVLRIRDSNFIFNGDLVELLAAMEKEPKMAMMAPREKSQVQGLS
jgi:hypothetical protein